MTDPDKFDVLHKSDRLTIFFSSTMENIDRVDTETKKFLTENGLQSKEFAICLGMREGLTNAIRHGHHFDQTKTVVYSLIIKDSRLIMEIEDEGEGFDWRAVQEKEPGINSDHGRGISIIRNYFNEYMYNDKGNKIVLTCNLSDNV